MTFYGKKHCDFLNSSASKDQKLNATYYDSVRVFQSIARYTGDASVWLPCRDSALKVYRDGYVIPANGGVPGYWIFTAGLRTHFEQTGDAESKRAVTMLATNAAWAADSAYNNNNMPNPEYSRETAYVGMAYLDERAITGVHKARLEKLLSFALTHYDKWFVRRDAPYVRPFMAALTAEFLIQYHKEVDADPRILPALRAGAEWLWNNCWVSSAKAFKYTDRVVASGGTEPAPDLNLLIAPLYAWLHRETGEAVWKDRAVAIFNGGVAGSFLGNGKQFNQNYRSSFGLFTPGTETPVPSPTATRTAPPTPTVSPTRTVTPTATVSATPTLPVATPVVIELEGRHRIIIQELR
jgi:hypothetical protein